jgi:hypothetical protein
MSTFINTDIGAKEPGLPISLIVAVLFVGIQLVVFVPSAIVSLSSAETIYATPASFNVVSLVTGVLLLAYLALDFWRWWQRGIGKAYYFAFAGTAILLVGILVFLAKVAGLITA